MFPKRQQALQIMSHAVVGYPSLDENEHAIEGLVQAGVKMIELQVPFTDPVADGNTLVNACYHGLAQGGSVQATLDLCAKVSKRFPDTCFILMSYLNPLYQYGLDTFFKAAAQVGFQGMIIPDMSVEHYQPFMPLLDELKLAPILMVAPNTSNERLAQITQSARGMLYVVSRLGVTGHKTHWGSDFQEYVKRIRQFTDLPLAIGFGIRTLDDLTAVAKHAEVAALCSQYIEWQRDHGSDTAAQHMATLVNELNQHLQS